MINLQERLNSIKEYFVSMEMVDGKWAVCAQYRDNWCAYPPDDGSVELIEDENEKNHWWYVAKDESVVIDKLISLVEETVQTNIDAIRKVELFKEKATELKRIFSDEKLTLAQLQTLRFVFDGVQVPVKKEPVVQNTKKTVASKKEILSKAESQSENQDVFKVSAPEPVHEERPRKSQKAKAVKAVEKPEVTVSAVDMTKEEIDDLRG